MMPDDFVYRRQGPPPKVFRGESLLSPEGRPLRRRREDKSFCYSGKVAVLISEEIVVTDWIDYRIQILPPRGRGEVLSIL